MTRFMARANDATEWVAVALPRRRGVCVRAPLSEQPRGARSGGRRRAQQRKIIYISMVYAADIVTVMIDRHFSLELSEGKGGTYDPDFDH